MTPDLLALLRRIEAYLKNSLTYVYDQPTAKLHADVCAAIDLYKRGAA